MVHEPAATEAGLVQYYGRIYRERMAGLPICNPRLAIETVGFRDLDGHRLGILITPWFMNLVLLPGDERWAGSAEGGREELPLPSGPCEFTICRGSGIGTYLSAVLFRTVMDFPDRELAVGVAAEVLQQLASVPDRNAQGAREGRGLSRRALLTGQGPA